MRAWHLGAIIYDTKTCYLDATYYGADPRVYFCKKLQKRHICEIISRKWLNCKNYGRSPRNRAARGAGRPAAGRPAPRDLRAIFSANFFQKCPCRPAAGRPGPGRPAAGRQGLTCKKRRKKFADRSLGTGRPAAERPAPKAARLRGGRPYFLQFSPFHKIISHMCLFCNFLQK